MNCTYIKTCPSRMAFGDAPNGCNEVDESTCSSASQFYRWYQMAHVDRVPTHFFATRFVSLKEFKWLFK